MTVPKGFICLGNMHSRSEPPFLVEAGSIAALSSHSFQDYTKPKEKTEFGYEYYPTSTGTMVTLKTGLSLYSDVPPSVVSAMLMEALK